MNLNLIGTGYLVGFAEAYLEAVYYLGYVRSLKMLSQKEPEPEVHCTLSVFGKAVSSLAAAAYVENLKTDFGPKAKAALLVAPAGILTLESAGAN